MANKTVKVTLVRSIHGRKPGHAECVKGLGIRKINQSVEIEDTPCNRGMINKASYMLKVEEV